jgi:hypothetical protein
MRQLLGGFENSGYVDISGIWVDTLLPEVALAAIRGNLDVMKSSHIRVVQLSTAGKGSVFGANSNHFKQIISRNETFHVISLGISKDVNGNLLTEEQYEWAIHHESGHSVWRLLSGQKKDEFRSLLGSDISGSERSHARWTEEIGRSTTGAEFREESFADYYGFAKANELDKVPSQLHQFFRDLIEDSGDNANLNDVGGIDFNPATMNLQIKRDGRGVPLPFENQPAAIMQIDGLIPVIINVVPANMPMLLGFADIQPTEAPLDQAQYNYERDLPFDRRGSLYVN